jgi:hypothetical protein
MAAGDAAGARISPPQQNLFRRVAERTGEWLEVVEPQSDQVVLEPRQLLLGNP